MKLLNGGHNATEYFLVEVRDFSSWDEGLKGLFKDNAPPDFEGGLLIMHVDEAIGSGSIELGNDINDASKNPHQGVMAVDAQYPHPRDRGKPSTPFTLWWGDNPEIRGSAQAQSGTTAKTVNFTRPDSNFYNNVASGVSITGIGNARGGMTATVTTPQAELFTQSENSLGCNSTGVIFPALALIVCGIFLANSAGLTRRRGNSKFASPNTLRPKA